MSGQKILMSQGRLEVPNHPVIPFIEGDGSGPDIWRATLRVLDSAVAKSFNNTKKIIWKEVLAGQKAFDRLGEWLPQATVQAFREYLVGIKGPLTTPVGGGFRSLNVALRQELDLYVCLRPVRYFPGTPSPVRHPEKIDMVIFRENTEDVYAGLEVSADSPEAKVLSDFVKQTFKRRLAPETGIGLKIVSRQGSERLIRAAIEYAIQNKRRSVTLVHKGNIQKFTEGAFMRWGYELARTEYSEQVVSWDQCQGHPPAGKILIKDSIADIFLQQILTRPAEFDVIATLNLNGDYISDALAAQVGGIGIAPGGNLNYRTGHALFEATHGTAPKYAGQDKVNPSSMILSGVMMLRYLNWTEAADLVESSLEAAIASKHVTYDFARLMNDANTLKCSEFADQIIAHM